MYKLNDKKIEKHLNDELNRQNTHIELIASENFVSEDVLVAQGSVLTNKYAEGYPFKRYYGGCEFVDECEQLAIDRLKEMFGADHANVQPHSGSSANMGVYMTILEPGDTVLGMDLAAGGHLTHGHPLSFSGKLYNFVGYVLDKETETIDYDQVRKQAIEHKPKLIVAGASAYAREIDFKKFREIADEVGAMLMVDMAHIAGLCATGHHMNPAPYADFMTTTTHKTLRGPRGGAILCKAKYAKDLDRTIFPGIQGGPLMHVIAAKAVAFGECLKPEFKEYMGMVKETTSAMADEFKKMGARVISGGSDNHMFMVDVKETYGITGKKAENILHEINITLNKNSIPFDTESPFKTSGIRIGTAAMTTKGFNVKSFTELATIIDAKLRGTETNEVLLKKVADLIKRDVTWTQK